MKCQVENQIAARRKHYAFNFIMPRLWHLSINIRSPPERDEKQINQHNESHLLHIFSKQADIWLSSIWAAQSYLLHFKSQKSHTQPPLMASINAIFIFFSTSLNPVNPHGGRPLTGVNPNPQSCDCLCYAETQHVSLLLPCCFLYSFR